MRLGQGRLRPFVEATGVFLLGWMVTAIKSGYLGVRTIAPLLASTMLSGIATSAHAQAQAAPPPVAAAPAPQVVAPAAPAVAPLQTRVIRSLRVEGAQRLEEDTVLSYTKLRVGQPYNTEIVDQAIKDLLASDLLADVEIATPDTGDLIIRVKENPVINRVLFEGNKNLKQDKIDKEIKLRPRQIFTRTAVRADVARLIELYRRQGRFAAEIEPKMVSLDQNRVDVVFEVHEGPKSKVRQINIIGNEVFSDSKLRDQMATRVASLKHLFSSNTSYDQDRLAYDQQKMRQFYLTEGYANFRVISAVAELTPDKRDFIITYVVEEGKRYHFGPVTVDSDIRDFDGKRVASTLAIKQGQWYNAKRVEDTIDSLTELAGTYGYAFADVRPEYDPDRDNLTMKINFHIGEANRTYIEKIDITGNRVTKDKVIRREMRLSEGDAFNQFSVKRSQDRINSLGFFQDKFEIEQKPGSSPDRVILAANVEEKPSGELTLSAGFSSLEKFILQGSVRQRNFGGRGQDMHLSVDWSSYSKSAEIGFTEPYLFNKNMAAGVTIFRRDYNSFNYIGDSRNTTYSQISTGAQFVIGVPLTEYWTLSTRYQISKDDVSLDKNTFYIDTNGDGIPDTCNFAQAGRYYCEAVGNRLTSLIGTSLIYDSLNSRLRPSRGQRVIAGVDIAGLGGQVRYLRLRADATKFWSVGKGFIFSLAGEGGLIKALEKAPATGVDAVRITDRFYLGEPQFRGFDIRGVGPRVQRIPYLGDPKAGTQLLTTDKNSIYDDALGGRMYYLGKAELEIPLGAGAREMGLRPSIFAQIGGLWGITKPLPATSFTQATDAQGKLLYNKDGSPTIYFPQVTDNGQPTGQPLYQVPSSDPNHPGAYTTCVTGYADTFRGACAGASVNSPYLNTNLYLERFVGNTAKPRISVGFGVNWNSPFGPLRIDIAKVLVKAQGDDTKLITFNVGTQF